MNNIPCNWGGSATRFTAGTRVLVPGARDAVRSTRAEASYADSGDNKWIGTPVFAALGIAGYALAGRRSREDDEKKRAVTLLVLFGEDAYKLEDGEGGYAMNDETLSEYERRVDALCDALFHGDDLLETAVLSEGREASAPPPATSGIAAAAAVRCASRSATDAASRRRRRAAAKAPRRSRRKALGTTWLIGCLILAAFFGLRPPSAPRRSAAIAASPPASTAARFATRSIEDIRVGQRVLGENPDLAEWEHSTRTEVDPATWRLVRLHAVGRWDDGTLDTIEIETLQPLSWLLEQRARIGRSVPIPCDLEELALPPDMRGTVTAIEHCPKLEEGPGHLVLLTVNHLNNTVCDLVVRDKAGNRETIGVTAIHRFYSDTRHGWIAAASLRPGEQLRGIDGALSVTQLKRRAGVERVYNMTVEGEHVYHVSATGALAHNAYAPGPGAPFPSNASPGQLLNGVDPSTLQAGRQNLVAQNLADQLDLINNGIPRATPIQVTPQGVIWDGNHGAAAAIQLDVAVDIEVIGGPAMPGWGPPNLLPILPH